MWKTWTRKWSLNFEISHGILRILPPNFARFLPFIANNSAWVGNSASTLLFCLKVSRMQNLNQDMVMVNNQEIAIKSFGKVIQYFWSSL